MSWNTPKKMSFRSDDAKTALLDQIEGFPVPVAAEGLRVLAGTPVLKAAEPRAIAASVLEQKDAAGFSAHAAELFQRGDGVRERAEAHRVDDRIEGFIRERQVLGVHHFELGGETNAFGAPSRLRQHPLAEIDPRQANFLGIVREILPRPDGDLQDISARPLAEPASKPPSAAL